MLVQYAAQIQYAVTAVVLAMYAGFAIGLMKNITLLKPALALAISISTIPASANFFWKMLGETHTITNAYFSIALTALSVFLWIKFFQFFYKKMELQVEKNFRI